ncbi:hypothetical protein [Nocardia jejuensis]|nr:hypothetical protein [Nocardia jejuensis]
MRDRPVGMAWQQYVYPGSQASKWLLRAIRVGQGFFVATVVLLAIAVLT